MANDRNDLPRIGTQLPWDRLPRESDEAWQAFVEFRDLGLSRSSARVADILGKSVSLLNSWSSKWSWRRRAALYDQHLDHHRQSEHEKAIREMARKHITASAFMLHKAMTVIKAADESTITIKDAIAMFRAAVPAERQGRAAEQAILPREGAGLLGETQEPADYDDEDDFGIA